MNFDHIVTTLFEPGGVPLRVFAKHLKNGLALSSPKLCDFLELCRSSFKFKSLKIGHSLLAWYSVNGGVLG